MVGPKVAIHRGAGATPLRATSGKRGRSRYRSSSPCNCLCAGRAFVASRVTFSRPAGPPDAAKSSEAATAARPLSRSVDSFFVFLIVPQSGSMLPRLPHARGPPDRLSRPARTRVSTLLGGDRRRTARLFPNR